MKPNVFFKVPFFPQHLSFSLKIDPTFKSIVKLNNSVEDLTSSSLNKIGNPSFRSLRSFPLPMMEYLLPAKVMSILGLIPSLSLFEPLNCCWTFDQLVNCFIVSTSSEGSWSGRMFLTPHSFFYERAVPFPFSDDFLSSRCNTVHFFNRSSSWCSWTYFSNVCAIKPSKCQIKYKLVDNFMQLNPNKNSIAVL